MEAFWNCSVLDRPFVHIPTAKTNAQPWPQKQFASNRERWLDVEFAVEMALALTENILWKGDSIPVFFPNLGPEVMSCGFGAELEFSEYTSWSKPVIHDWNQVEGLKFDPDNFYIQKICELIKLGVEKGKGKFITGITDIHPGGDLAASLREPQQFCIDMMESPDEVEALLQKIQPAFEEFYNLQYDLMQTGGQVMTTTWAPLYTEGKYYVPSNDFSCMISPRSYKKYFVERLEKEIEFLDRSIYHLDGPNALQHLPAILGMKKLDAVQWVFGAGNGTPKDWIHVYKQIQDAGKGIQIIECGYNDLDAIISTLKPEGVAITTAAGSEQEADAFLKKVTEWKK